MSIDFLDDVFGKRSIASEDETPAVHDEGHAFRSTP
jgi:hypothetical protein